MIPVAKSHLFVAAITHEGMKGKNNEDRFSVSAFRLEEAKNQDADSAGPGYPRPVLLAVVCDGIGGHRAGEVAAEIAVEMISRVVAESDGSDPRAVLSQAIMQASRNIRDQAARNDNQHGMGATCVCAWVIGERLYTASVGDSRLYLARHGQIFQVTTDHTWIQEAIEMGALTPDQARGHPNAHVIRRYLGSVNPPAPDFRLRLSPDEDDARLEANQGLALLPGDRLVLCSDGLTDLVEKEEILSALLAHGREEALQTLVGLANERGGHDNITIVLVEAPPNLGAGEIPTIPLQVRHSEQQKKRRISWAMTCAVVFAVFALLTTALVNWWLWQRNGARGTETTARPTATLRPPFTPRPTVTFEALKIPTATPFPQNIGSSPEMERVVGNLSFFRK